MNRCKIKRHHTPLPPQLRERVKTHPCFCEEAHFHYARMHLPVAPRCNVQCNYCNRRYDCVNESRPGVTSALVTPEEALQRVAIAIEAIPQLSVVGIAGPGDPLANPERTFRTLEAVRANYPDLRLCLSTNGLDLPEHLDDIVSNRVEHVTVTINAIEPHIATRLYRWVRPDGVTLRGNGGTERLLERQMAGLRGLVDRNILVKINTVLVPGINDTHIPTLARQVKAMGAFVVNIIPFIPVPGTPFEDRAAPTFAERRAIQDACEIDISIMRHCRQCRADAVGLLGDDRSLDLAEVQASLPTKGIDRSRRTQALESAMENMEARRRAKMCHREIPYQRREPLMVAVASKAGGMVNERFGRAREFLIYEVSGGSLRFLEARSLEHYYGGSDARRDSIEGTARSVALLSDCRLVLAEHIEPAAKEALEASGINPFEAEGYLEEAIVEAVGEKPW